MPAEQLVLEAPPIEKPWWERGVWANGQRPDISERPSLMARYALMAMATTLTTIRHDHRSDEAALDVAEWWTERARRMFRVALWADDALYGDAR